VVLESGVPDSAFIFLACPRKTKQKERHLDTLPLRGSLRFSKFSARPKTRPTGSNTWPLFLKIPAMLGKI